jgi:hypothetical protein
MYWLATKSELEMRYASLAVHRADAAARFPHSQKDLDELRSRQFLNNTFHL